ncbi:dead deah box DNA helicase [Diplocarpon rosae]|nr:dead deah box DNA helicase [Diplocarpon rosae]
MSPSAAEDGVLSTSSDQNHSTDHKADAIEPNHESPARTVILAENEQPEQSATHKEDPATMAASEELKHTTISDKATVPRVLESAMQPAGGDHKAVAEMATASPSELEPTDARYEEMKDRLSSPKKKRGRDQVEDAKELGDDNVDEAGSSADGSLVNGSRTTRSGPEKKRHRDTSEELPKAAEKLIGESPKIGPAESKTDDLTTNSTSKEDSPSAPSSGPKTSAAAFAGSSFASLAASTSSPFGSIGASKPSIFSSGVQPATSGFGALATAKPPSPTSTSNTSGFGLASGEKTATGFGFGSGVSSGFGGLASGSVFGSKLGNGFAGGPGTKLSSFAAPIGNESTTLSTKPAKAFGAPESDEDAGSDEDDTEGGAASDDESGHVPADDKKKSKPSRVADGEAGEATLLQLRAKLFALESKEAGWKERGVGTLKINVPKSCVSYDDYGVPQPGSFDLSGLEDDEAGSGGPRVARLIMRQENTHRVVLNTAIVRAMEFKDKPSNSTAQIIFTAFEGDKEPKPVNMLLKMSEANARNFRAELESVQRKL